MIINFATPLRDFEGKPIKDGDANLTIKDIVNRSLIGSMPQQQGAKLSQDEAVKCFELAVKITQAPEAVDLEAAQIVLIDKAIGMCLWPPLVYGQVKKVLEGQPTGLEPTDET